MQGKKYWPEWLLVFSTYVPCNCGDDRLDFGVYIPGPPHGIESVLGRNFWIGFMSRKRNPRLLRLDFSTHHTIVERIDSELCSRP